jgi:DDE superfamily endonuclease
MLRRCGEPVNRWVERPARDGEAIEVPIGKIDLRVAVPGVWRPNQILHEGIDALAARAPSLHGALLAAKAAGYGHVSIDGVLIETDQVSTPGPTPGVDLWWSGKHANHGGNVQVITVPDGWPIWTSDVRPGREHDTTALRTHAEILPALAEAAGDLRSLGDLGYEGEADTITVAFKKPKDRTLTGLQHQFNKAHNGIRAIGERGNALLKMTFKPLRNVSLDPGASAASSPPPWSFSTSTTPAPHDNTQ